jgi:hypothetical protein
VCAALGGCMAMDQFGSVLAARHGTSRMPPPHTEQRRGGRRLMVMMIMTTTTTTMMIMMIMMTILMMIMTMMIPPAGTVEAQEAGERLTSLLALQGPVLGVTALRDLVRRGTAPGKPFPWMKHDSESP